MNVGARVRVLGVPFAGREGAVVEACFPSDLKRWPVWVKFEGRAHPVGFDEAECVVLQHDSGEIDYAGDSKTAPGVASTNTESLALIRDTGRRT